ncbi:MAG: class I SAM-dependent methyltransferase [Candidatus Wallbacteria bacterium]|nr:class I SAM-dependent methyltransferase [Candidatus Wallbacteria bacterium]
MKLLLPAWLVAKLRALKQLRQLRAAIERALAASEQPATRSGRSVVEAMRAASRYQPAPDEQAWIDRIEDVRAALDASDEVVEFDDFGCGEATTADLSVAGLASRPRAGRLGEFSMLASKTRPWAYLLFQVVRRCRPKWCLEMGTCVGVSGSYLGAALKLNGGGRLTTLEGAQAFATIARKTFDRLGLDTVSELRVGPFSLTLPRLLEGCEPIDFFFVDGHHDGAATQAYFRQLLAHASEDAVFVFDDIEWSAGMADAWRTIRQSPSVTYSAGLANVGIVVTTRRRGEPTQGV